MTTLEEHAARIEEMKIMERQIREFLSEASGQRYATVPVEWLRFSIERVDAYEASITWHTDCLTCPKLYDQIYEMDQHTIPAMRKALEKARDALRGDATMRREAQAVGLVDEALFEIGAVLK